MVDAGDDQRRPLGQKAEDTDVDAVRRRAVDGVPPLAQRLHAQGPVQRERVAAGALLALGRQHVDLAQIGEGRREGHEPGRVDAVVVGDEEKGHQILRRSQEVRIPSLSKSSWFSLACRPGGGRDEA